MLYRILAKRSDCKHYQCLDWNMGSKKTLHICMLGFIKMVEKKDLTRDVECLGMCNKFEFKEEKPND